jgi:hypothetical protein
MSALQSGQRMRVAALEPASLTRATPHWGQLKLAVLMVQAANFPISNLQRGISSDLPQPAWVAIEIPHLHLVILMVSHNLVVLSIECHFAGSAERQFGDRRCPQ